MRLTIRSDLDGRIFLLYQLSKGPFASRNNMGVDDGKQSVSGMQTTLAISCQSSWY